MKYLSSYGDETLAESLKDKNQMSGFVTLRLSVSLCDVHTYKDGLWLSYWSTNMGLSVGDTNYQRAD